jgi:hypothetical protein
MTAAPRASPTFSPRKMTATTTTTKGTLCMTAERLASCICMRAETNMKDPSTSNNERNKTVRVKIIELLFKAPCWAQIRERKAVDNKPTRQMISPRGRVVPISFMHVSPPTKQTVVMTM